MASIYKEILIEAPSDEVWDAVRDFDAVHTRLAPGFVTDAKKDGDARIVTFSNGTVARETARQLRRCETTAGLRHRQRADHATQRFGPDL